MTNPTKHDGAPLAPLIGQLVWNVKRGVGTFLTMEFGAPHLSVREPIVPKSAVSPRGQRALRRRRVFVEGDGHLWIQHADWKLETAHGMLASADHVDTELDEALLDLDGQRLQSAVVESAANRWQLKFDLGATLDIWPAKYEAEVLWSLHAWNGHITVCRQDGSCFDEEAERAGSR